MRKVCLEEIESTAKSFRLHDHICKNSRLMRTYGNTIDENSMTDGQPKMKSAFGKSCNDLLAERTQVHELLLKESNKMDDLLHPFMMNQATPHLEGKFRLDKQ